MGVARPGLEVYLVQSSSTGTTQNGVPALKSPTSGDVERTAAGSYFIARNTDTSPTPSKEAVGTQYTAVNGVLQPLPNLATSSARSTGFLGQPLPAGDVHGVVSQEMEWAIRRQVALRMISTQTEFLRQAFPSLTAVRCLVGLDQTICQPSGQGVAEMLSALYMEAHHMDPSLPAMVWESQAHGAWSYEFKP